VKATEAHLPADLAICTAAVGIGALILLLLTNLRKKRATLIWFSNLLIFLPFIKSAPAFIGFAAETENAVKNAQAKLAKCDWVIANDVNQGVLEDDTRSLDCLHAHEVWPRCSKKKLLHGLSLISQEFFNDYSFSFTTPPWRRFASPFLCDLTKRRGGLNRGS
jgi:hypothetical protein